jgi:hypothetical protein
MQIPFADFVSHYATLVISVAAVVDYPKEILACKIKKIPSPALGIFPHFMFGRNSLYRSAVISVRRRVRCKRERPESVSCALIFIFHLSSFPRTKSYWHRGGSMVSTPSARVRVI